MNDRLQPQPGSLYVVRWIRLDGRNTKHKYFRRESDAHRFLDKLMDGGWDAALYVLPATTWKRLR